MFEDAAYGSQGAAITFYLFRNVLVEAAGAIAVGINGHVGEPESCMRSVRSVDISASISAARWSVPLRCVQGPHGRGSVSGESLRP